MKKKWLLSILLIIIILIPTIFLIFQEKEEEEEDLKHKRFKDLGIVSAKEPFSTHLWWEHSTYGLILVDADDQTKLFISTDKGDNWVEIDLSDNANSFKIQAGWLDGNDLWLVMCDNDGNETEFEVSFVELDDSNDCNPVDVQATSAGDAMFVYDVFKLSTDFYVYWNDDIGAGAKDWITEVTVSPFVAKDDLVEDVGRSTHVFVEGANAFWWKSVAPFTRSYHYKYASAVPAIQKNVAFIDLYTVLATDNFRGVSYDGSNISYAILEKNADSKKYLVSFTIDDPTYTVIAQHSVVLMLDRNTATGIFEKGFSIDSTETVYEVKARRGGIRVLQDMSAITDAVIIAITDNFLMNDDGDMFEFTDVTKEISTISYNDGIIGIQKRGRFTVHPDFHANWSIGDSIKIYDDNDLLEFHGLIIDKNRNRRGIYIFKIDSFTNEIYRKTYNKSYSADDTDTKQKDIIDNGCDFCYRSSSIVGTTTTYDYVYNRAIIYLFWLARFLERQVPYVEPDGKIWTKAHDGLVKNAMIYPGSYNFKDEEDGTSGIDIEFIYSTTGTGADCSATIIASLDGHRKVLQLSDENGAGRFLAYHGLSGVAGAIGDQPFGTVEFFITTTDTTKRTQIIFYDLNLVCMVLQIDLGKFQYDDDGGRHDLGLAAVDDTKYRIRIDFESTAGGYQGLAQYDWHIYVDGSLYGDFNFVNDGTLDRVLIVSDVGDSGYKTYIDAWGELWDPAYTIGDNEVAWNINNHWQEVSLIDIPSLEEIVQGFFDGNSGVTRNTIRYKNNATVVRPVAATRDPIEQLQGILPLNEFRDPKLEAATEANQLGDNRYNIWSSDIIFLGLRIEGQGYLQPGKTVEIQNTGQITIAKNDYLILSFERDPKNDVYMGMILSDNIIFPREFSNLQNTTTTQVHTASVQTIENQAAIATGGVTPPIGVKMDYFGTGIKGTITTRDYEISVANGDDFDMLGWFVANGQASTPNCIDKFVRNEATSGVAGGSDDAIVVSHVHEVHITGGEGATDKLDVTASFGTQVGFNTQSAGVSSVGKNIPAKISAIPIIRMS